VIPGEFSQIVTEAVLQYRDLELRDRAKEAYAEFESGDSKARIHSAA